MKIVGHGKILSNGETKVPLDPSICAAFRIDPKSRLFSVVMSPKGLRPSSSSGEALSQWATVVATPLEPKSWGKLLRISLTVDPKRGALSAVVSGLTQVGLVCHQIDSSNGLDLLSTKTYHPSAAGLSALSQATQPAGGFLLPSTLIVAELPEKGTVHTGDDEIDETHAAEELRQSFTKILKSPQHAGEARDLLELYLKHFLEESNQSFHLKVDWVSPMESLNHLRNHLGDYLIEIIATGNESRIPLSQEGQFLVADLRRVREWIWQVDETIPDRDKPEPPGQLFCLQHCDHDEKIIVLDLFWSESRHFVCHFALLVKTPFLHAWWEWILERIKKAGGNILTTETFCPQQGGWSKVTLNVLFRTGNRTYVDGDSSIEKILECMFEMQGFEGETEEFRKVFYEDYLVARCGASRQDAQSTLMDIRVWDPEFQRRTNPAFSNKFSPNDLPDFFGPPIT